MSDKDTKGKELIVPEKIFLLGYFQHYWKK